MAKEITKEITKVITDEEGKQVVETVTKAPMSTRKKVIIGAGIALGVGAAIALVKSIFFGGNAEPDTEHNFCTADDPEECAEDDFEETEEE